MYACRSFLPCSICYGYRNHLIETLITKKSHERNSLVYFPCEGSMSAESCRAAVPLAVYHGVSVLCCYPSSWAALLVISGLLLWKQVHLSQVSTAVVCARTTSCSHDTCATIIRRMEFTFLYVIRFFPFFFLRVNLTATRLSSVHCSAPISLQRVADSYLSIFFAMITIRRFT